MRAPLGPFDDARPAGSWGARPGGRCRSTPAVADTAYVVAGSRRRRGKLIAPGKPFAFLPGAELVEGLCA
ncbi:hypothetical protein [Streptomyces sp. NPDC058701]|uniref:hypothetical protein n=1 Tax=Streptomyces sp. NPDC058701 TaxID=3346608 RepID=UPI00365DFF46